MRRHDIIIKLLLLICFFLSRNMTRECREVHFKIGPAKIIAKPNYERVMPTWVEEKKWHKHPSGPNPTGNRHPPVKP
ncbi:unnamed protein product [Arabidopsis lyrata]|uniref:Uncharacterized protein n=1 Tax=Arabidopsis lyrata subsp. lyrata TaxID=81972 RepID=D7MRT7_ARALL|nr:CLAVATA3/ESR (CLE)-related protein 46 isoform X2 [Arabidopsis lyrata subsp. lyrata]EFH40884.1 hypothetical protein ARALYDRAFT_919160 [Arabidopsis lyrata subsp. lyrata]CAH8280216.1 unnamed protein product [Arabidopsis lyrata]|eukprot:XP_002864625.1 CLAVATA3/ESR (CLE)-related protein 46 isoform X2 [Arabidopsis lyrata subsp. lyrata]